MDTRFHEKSTQLVLQNKNYNNKKNVANMKVKKYNHVAYRAFYLVKVYNILI